MGKVNESLSHKITASKTKVVTRHQTPQQISHAALTPLSLHTSYIISTGYQETQYTILLLTFYIPLDPPSPNLFLISVSSFITTLHHTQLLWYTPHHTYLQNPARSSTFIIFTPTEPLKHHLNINITLSSAFKSELKHTFISSALQLSQTAETLTSFFCSVLQLSVLSWFLIKSCTRPAL